MPARNCRCPFNTQGREPPRLYISPTRREPSRLYISPTRLHLVHKQTSTACDSHAHPSNTYLECNLPIAGSPSNPRGVPVQERQQAADVLARQSWYTTAAHQQAMDALHSGMRDLFSSVLGQEIVISAKSCRSCVVYQTVVRHLWWGPAVMASRWCCCLL